MFRGGGSVGSGSALLPLAEERARLFAIGGNRTNAFLRAVKGASVTPIASLTEDGSRLSVKKFADQPLFQEAITHGLKWTVIAYTVEKAVPGFVDFVISAAAEPPPPCLL